MRKLLQRNAAARKAARCSWVTTARTTRVCCRRTATTSACLPDAPAARRGESSNYTLTVGVSGKALAPTAATSDALIPGTSYHASAKIKCCARIRNFAARVRCRVAWFWPAARHCRRQNADHVAAASSNLRVAARVRAHDLVAFLVPEVVRLIAGAQVVDVAIAKIDVDVSLPLPERAGAGLAFLRLTVLADFAVGLPGVGPRNRNGESCAHGKYY